MQHWFVQLTRAIKLPGAVSGGLIFLLITIIFAIPLDVFSFRFDDLDYRNSVGVSLFFGGLTAYALVVGTWVIRRSEEAFDSWSEKLSCTETALVAARKSISYSSTRYNFTVIVVALILASIHSLVISGGFKQLWEDLRSPGVAGIIGTCMMWIIVMSIICAFVKNANTYVRLIKNHLPIDLFNSDYRFVNKLARLPALCMAGIQVLFPLLSLDAIFDGNAVLPGVAMTLGVTCYVFLRPTLAIRSRIRETKEALLRNLDAQIGNQHKPGQSIDCLDKLQPTLVYRMYVESVAEWPINLSGFARWFVFLIIPPATWVGAALIENVVDGLL